MKTELERLKEKVAELERKQRACNHEWNKPVYDPETKEIKRIEFIEMGSDSHHEEVGTGLYENVDRWSRVCQKCGKKSWIFRI